MKSIEECAYDYYASEQCPRTCENCEWRQDCLDVDDVQNYITGAYHERKRLLKWNSPKCPPENYREILVKVKNGYNIASYNPDKGYCIKGGFYTEIIGWREIHELY